MKTNHEHRFTERGNALIYVLIGIALFAALTFVLTRQNDTQESGTISGDKASLYATQMISYATQVKQIADQMTFSGAHLDDLDFTPPSDPDFNNGTAEDHIHNIYHPDGGGLVPGSIPSEAVKQIDGNPAAGWYLGRFNNVDWTKTASHEVVLTAYQIRPEVCMEIDRKLGFSSIPVITAPLKQVFIDDANYSNSTNTDLTTDAGEICTDCHNRASLCVQQGGMYAFYTIVGDQ